MSQKNQRTACSPLPWEDVLRLIDDLKRNGEPRFALLVGIGAFTGLRISDILAIHWKQILNADILDVREKKTSKLRRIYLNPKLQELIAYCYELLKAKNLSATALEQLVFLNRFGTKAISVQYVDRMLPQFLKKSNIEIRNTGTGTHLLRKSFARQVFRMHESSSFALVLISDILGHQTLKTTRAYIGLQSEQFQKAYNML